MNVKQSHSDTVLILNSANATNKDLTIGKAEYYLKDPLRFEKSSPKIAINSLSFTNFFYNISASIGNNKIFYSDDDADDTKYSITINDGSYSTESLNSFVSNELTAAGRTGLFEILPDYSQNKIYIKWGNFTGWYSHFSATTPYLVLGMTLNQYIPADKACSPYEVNYATNIAAFNNIESINVKTNLSNNIILGTGQSNVLYQTQPTVEVGSIQKDAPINLLWSDSYALSSGISYISIELTDQNNDALYLTENFSVILQIRT